MSARREQLAEYAVLHRFDELRERAGHDYGSGQRGAELIRRRRALGYASAFEVELVDELRLLTAGEVLAAFRRVGDPRIERLELETYRKHTPASRRTLDTWHRLELELERHERIGLAPWLI